MKRLVTEDRRLIWSMIGVSLLFHVALVIVALFASTRLFIQEGVIYSVHTVNLVDLDLGEDGGRLQGIGSQSLTKVNNGPRDPSTNSGHRNGQQTEDILKPEPKVALAELPSKGNLKEPSIPPLEQKKQEAKSKEPEVDPKPQAPSSKSKKEELKMPAPKTKETPEVKEETQPVAAKPQPSKQEPSEAKPKSKKKEPEPRVEERKAPTPPKVASREEERPPSAEEIRQRRLSPFQEPLLDKPPPPMPRETITAALQREESGRDRPAVPTSDPRRMESPGGRREGAPGSFSLELEGNVQQGSPVLISYLEVVTRTIKNRWLPPSGSGRGIIEFTIFKTGEVSDVRILRSSGDKNLDQSLIRAVEASNPLPELPLGLQQELDRLNDSFLRVKFHFRRRLS